MPSSTLPLVQISRWLSRQVDALAFSAPVALTYNPLNYARAPHEAYLDRYGTGHKQVLIVGMNPGPFGMAQTGVPFGDVVMVRQWLGLEGRVRKPPLEHPKRPISGFDCPRREVSGSRLWGWVRDEFGTPERFFADCFVANYCPLVFMDAAGRNITPDKLGRSDRLALYSSCDEALRRVVALLGARVVVGVGGFAEGRARAALDSADLRILTLTHPSPANPRANRGWGELASQSLRFWGLSGTGDEAR